MTAVRKNIRVYVDTSVVGGQFDETQQAEQTRPFWDAVTGGNIRIIASSVLEEELTHAPPHVKRFFADLPASQIERITADAESEALAAQYIAAGVVGQSSLDDCRHIALATIHHADRLVSWNFKHIVNDKRIHGYHAVNIKLGYPAVEIITPYILINGYDEDED